MELFTLGPGNYSEQDVRESARAHTGYSLEKGRGFIFRPAQHDTGSKTFLGETGNFDADDIVDVILKQDAAPRHFARKLFEFFAYPYAEPEVIAPIADVARQTGFDTKQVVRAVLTSDAFYSRKAYRAIVKSPVDFAIGALRLFDSNIDPRTIVGAMRVMGQTLFDPPNVAGWPGGRTWLGTSTWFARVNGAAQLMNGGVFEEGRLSRPGMPNKGRTPRIAAANLAALFSTPPASADDAIGQASRAIIDGRMSDDARETLRAYMDEGGGYASLPRATQEQRIRGLAALLLASPEYQLAWWQMDTTRITTACPCRACARLAGVAIIRPAEEARFAPAHTRELLRSRGGRRLVLASVVLEMVRSQDARSGGASARSTPRVSYAPGLARTVLDGKPLFPHREG